MKATEKTTLAEISSVSDRVMLVGFEAMYFGIQCPNRTLAEEAASKHKVKNPARIRAVFDILGKDQIEEIVNTISRAREDHYRLTWNWTEDRLRALSNANYAEYTKVMKDHEIAFNKAVSSFVGRWDQIVANEKSELGSLWKAENYPSKATLKDCFIFRFEVQPVNATFLKSDPRVKDLVDPEVQRQVRLIEHKLQKNNSTDLRDYVKGLSSTISGYADSLNEYRTSSSPRNRKLQESEASSRMAGIF